MDKNGSIMAMDKDNLSLLFVLVHRRGGRILSNNSYGAGTGQIWLDGVQCNGTETSIADCPHNVWGTHDCGHNEDVSISCNFSPIRGLQTAVPVSYTHLTLPTKRIV